MSIGAHVDADVRHKLHIVSSTSRGQTFGCGHMLMLAPAAPGSALQDFRWTVCLPGPMSDPSGHMPADNSTQNSGLSSPHPAP